MNDFESLYWMKHFSFRLDVINVCSMLVPSELLLSTHLPTSEGWTAELTVGLWLVVPTTGFESTKFATKSHRLVFTFLFCCFRRLWMRMTRFLMSS